MSESEEIEDVDTAEEDEEDDVTDMEEEEKEEKDVCLVLAPYQEIAKFLHQIKLSNLLASLQYLGCPLESIYGEKKEMVIEAYLLLIEQLAIEDLAIYLPPENLRLLLTSLQRPTSESDDKNVEILLEYLFSTKLSTFLHETCPWESLPLLCHHLDIPIDPDDIKKSSNDDDHPKGNDLQQKYPQLIQTPVIRHKYATWMHEEFVFRGFRSSLFEQSLTISREWMRDVHGPVAGAKTVVVERVLSTILDIDEPQEMTEERVLYCEEIAARLRYNPNAKPKKEGKTKRGKGKKKGKANTPKSKNPKIPRNLRNVLPVPHPDDYVQDLQYSGGERVAIIKGVVPDSLMDQYTHAELRSYCSFFRLTQTGKKIDLVDRIIDFLENYDYSKPREPYPPVLDETQEENKTKDVSAVKKKKSKSTKSTTGKRSFEGAEPKKKKQKVDASLPPEEEEYDPDE